MSWVMFFLLESMPRVGKIDEVLLHRFVAVSLSENEKCRDALKRWRKAIQHHCAEHRIGSHLACLLEVQPYSLSPGEVVGHFLPWFHLQSSQLSEQRLDAGPLGAAVLPHNGFPGFHPVWLVKADEFD